MEPTDLGIQLVGEDSTATVIRPGGFVIHIGIHLILKKLFKILKVIMVLHV